LLGIGFFDNILAKYVATMVGFFLVSRPFFDTSNARMNASTKDELIQVNIMKIIKNNKNIFKIYYDNGRMMVQLASAFGRIALAGREMTRLAGRININKQINKQVQVSPLA
jgi:ATP-binding cassette subfamily D (ALD) protein 3